MFEFEASVGAMIWLTCFSVVTIGGILVSYPSITPHFFCNLFIFGKSRKSKVWNFRQNELFLLPKRWFFHFYGIGIINTVFWAALLYTKYFKGESPPGANAVLQFIRFPLTEGSGDMVPCYIVLACICIQVTRRCMECLTISVYSKDGTMSIVIYLVGAAFYMGLPISCVAGSNLSQEVKFSDLFAHCGVWQIVGVSMFMYGTLLQNWTARQFAYLRCNKKGVVVNDQHHIPRGGMFEYVSCPHYMAEILIYTAMATTFTFQNSIINCLVLFVVSNQFISAHFCHKWYKENFPKYPKKRKAIFPYLC